MEKVTQEDRIKAAAFFDNDLNPKAQKVRSDILTGLADDHPLVRVIADFREISNMTPEQLIIERNRVGV